MKTKNLPKFLSIFAFIGVATAASATILFEENFDSLNAGATVVGQNGWVNYSGSNSNALVANAPLAPYSSPNYLNLYAGAGVRNSFDPVSLVGGEIYEMSFYFLPNTTTAGHNLEMHLTTADGMAGSVFYLRLRGNSTSLDFGLSSSSTTQHNYASQLTQNTWYQFHAIINGATQEMTFSIAPANGGSAVFEESITLTGTSLGRVYFGTSGSTASGSWSVDNVSLGVVPEPGAAALGWSGLGMLLAWHGFRNSYWKRASDVQP